MAALPCRIHAVCVCDTSDEFYQFVDEQLETLGLTQDREGRPLRARDLVDIIDGYKELGYGKSTEEELGSPWAVRGKVYSDSVFSLVCALHAYLVRNPLKAVMCLICLLTRFQCLELWSTR